MNNLRGWKLKEDITSLLNNSGVEVIVGYYVIKDIYLDLERLLHEAIRNELTQEEKTVTVSSSFIDNNEKKENDYEQSISTDAPADSGSIDDSQH